MVPNEIIPTIKRALHGEPQLHKRGHAKSPEGLQTWPPFEFLGPQSKQAARADI